VNRPSLSPWRRCASIALGLLAVLASSIAAVAETASAWAEGYNSRARLVAAAAHGKLYAGVVIEMADGWKTYWRHPGDSGGVPPSFDWSKSDNLLSAVVLYPAPKRLTDPSGDAIGYSRRVVFPVRITPADPGRPVRLEAQLEYGVCKDICIPAEAQVALMLPTGLVDDPPTELTEALEQVPRVGVARRASDPRLLSTTAHLQGDKPRLVIEAEFSGNGADADAFIEAPDGIYVPQPKAVGSPKPGGSKGLVHRIFEIDLESGVEPSELKGKALTITLVSSAGHAQASWQLD
jgi:DsbC/DsbD-like thiol-disulfide interchange protein